MAVTRPLLRWVRRNPSQPWRTEGLRPGQGDEQKPPRPRWVPMVLATLLGYLLIFSLVTAQDQSQAAVTVPYIAFTAPSRSAGGDERVAGSRARPVRRVLSSRHDR